MRVPQGKGFSTLGSVMGFNTKVKLGILAAGFLLLFLLFLRWNRVEGNERLVTQNWRTGVNEEIVSSGTFWYVLLCSSLYNHVQVCDWY